MEKYDVSIIVPVYNREAIIKRCIESINSQTYEKSKWEVIFVDDASTDNTIDTIDTLIDKNINYRVLRRPVGSGNASAPRNEGIKVSTAKYVFFLDSDDHVDSELLENGMAIALKNDSDMVYVKLGGSRGNNKRSFKKEFVDDADVLTHHLMRSLKIFKFHKTKMLKDNKILFNPSIDVFEDMLFSCMCLSYSNKISILADKAYYFLEQHDEGHLSHTKMDLSVIMSMFITGLSGIFLSESTNKSKLYNAWLIKIVERLVILSKRGKIDDQKLVSFFTAASTYFNIYKGYFELSQIYDNEKTLTLLFLSGDFKGFYQSANESKVLNTLQKDIRETFKKEEGFAKAWIFKNKNVVLDFNINNNKLAFDFEVNEKQKTMKIWFFCRNNPSSLDALMSSPIKRAGNKYLIFEDHLSNQDKMPIVIKSYLDDLKGI
ncbi:glycosyltransferase family 2 protein [Psychrobacter alimentarius]|uniref:glycosyltransferase family 2 protein n=1 Tax=Psychrobacter alimentarius TaxID=261164 RepID=UPI003FD26DED